MTLFEFLAVFLSIVLSFGVIRLLDGLPSALKRGRGYVIHTLWVISVLFMHVQYWWVFWSYSTVVEWNYPRFLIVLASPFLTYSLTTALVPVDHGTVESWRDHFCRVRTRFFVLYACWWLVVALANLIVLGQPFMNGLRLFQATFIVLYTLGAISKRPWFHALLVAYTIGVIVFTVTFLFLDPAPLIP